MGKDWRPETCIGLFAGLVVKSIFLGSFQTAAQRE